MSEIDESWSDWSLENTLSVLKWTILGQNGQWFLSKLPALGLILTVLSKINGLLNWKEVHDLQMSNGSERMFIRPKMDGHGLMMVIRGRS